MATVYFYIAKQKVMFSKDLFYQTLTLLKSEVIRFYHQLVARPACTSVWYGQRLKYTMHNFDVEN
jgi:hypothetical protein